MTSLFQAITLAKFTSRAKSRPKATPEVSLLFPFGSHGTPDSRATWHGHDKTIIGTIAWNALSESIKPLQTEPFETNRSSPEERCKLDSSASPLPLPHKMDGRTASAVLQTPSRQAAII
jgi:hypothetical protein